MKHYEVTITIPTFNGEEFLDSLLASVFKQETKYTYEVLVIDSGSTDHTLEIVKRHRKVRLHQIPNSEFGHGKTRQLAVNISTSDYIIFLTQDAVPSHDDWLDSMIEPFIISEKVGCVLGKQIPRADCFATLKREVAQVFQSFGPDDMIALHRKTKLNDALGLSNTFLSDVNSAMRRGLVSKTIPFRDVSYAEDQAMGIDMLAAGYIKAYAPLGSVLHSHNYPLRKYFKRKFDESVGLRRSIGFVPRANFKELTLGTLRATGKDYRFIWKDKDYSWKRKMHAYLLAPCYNFANRWAMRLAASSKLTSEQETRMSLEASARKKNV